MATTPSPLHQKPIPKSVSKPTLAAEAAATVAESAVAPAPRKAKPAGRKSAAKKAPAAKPAPAAGKAASAKPAAKAVKAVEAMPAPKKAGAEGAAAKPAKAHKPKLVRDSFTIPKDEYQVLDTLKTRALGLGQHVRKSELLRAGIQALAAMNDRTFLKAFAAVPTLKTGRPKKG